MMTVNHVNSLSIGKLAIKEVAVVSLKCEYKGAKRLVSPLPLLSPPVSLPVFLDQNNTFLSEISWKSPTAQEKETLFIRSHRLCRELVKFYRGIEFDCLQNGGTEVNTRPNMADGNLESEILISMFRFCSSKISQRRKVMWVLLRMQGTFGTYVWRVL